MGRRDRRAAPPPAPVRSRRLWPAAVFVFGLAFSVRALVSFSLRDVPLWRTPALDSLEYLAWARRILESGFHWPNYAEHAPGYPFLLAALLFVLNGSTTLVYVAHAAIGGANAVLTARLAGAWFTRAAFLPAGILYAACAPLVLWEASLLGEGPFLFFTLSAMNLAQSSPQPRLRAVLTGLALGCAAIVRPTALILAPVLILAALRRGQWPRTSRVAAAGLLLFGVAAPVAPVVLQNYRTSGMLAIQGYGGFNFYLGNHPHRDGLASARPGGEWDWLEGAPGRAGYSQPGDADAFYVRQAVAAIGDEPGRYLRLLANKAWWLTQAEEIRDSHSFHFFASESRLLRLLPGFGLALALAAAGAVACVRRRHRCGLVVAFTMAMAATCVFLVVGSRYRAPVLPGLLAFAGAGVAWALEEARARNVKAMVAAVLVVTVGGAATLTRRHAPSHDLTEEWAFNASALRVEGNAAASEAAYRTALRIDDASSLAWTGLGTLKLTQGDTVQGIDHLQAAVRHNDRNAQAWHTLGDAYQQTGRTDAAIDAYARSLAIAPERTAPAEALGLTLVQNREYRRALPLLTKVAARIPDTARVETALAIATLSLGDVQASVRHARRAAELTPANSGAWLLLARAAGGAGRTDEAASALDTARRLGGDPVIVTAGRLHLMLLRGDRGGVEQALRELHASNPPLASAVAAELRSWSAAGAKGGGAPRP